MLKTVDDYIIQKQLFKDNFQVVYLQCQHKVLKKHFTLKKVQKASGDCHSKQEYKRKIILSLVNSCIQSQIQMSRWLISQKIIKCLKILKAKNAMYAVYDYLPQKNLKKIIMTQYMSLEKRQTIMNQIIQFIKQMHQQNVAIGNINPQNLFFTLDYKVRTSNFLICKKIIQDSEQKIDHLFLDNTCPYFSPQLKKRGVLTKSADIYSLGVIFSNLKIQKQDNDLLNPIKCSFQNLRELINKMLDQNYLVRPKISQVQKAFSLSLSRNKSTCGSNTSKNSRDNGQKIIDQKGLQSYRSEAILKSTIKMSQFGSLTLSNRRNVQPTKKQYFHPDYNANEPKKTYQNSKASLDSDIKYESCRQIDFQTPSMSKSRDQQQYRSYASIKYIQLPASKWSVKEKISEVMLTRNLVSFLIQMALFASEQASSKQLSYCLIQEALKYTECLLKKIQSLMKQPECSNQSLKPILQASKKQNHSLSQISNCLNEQAQNKGPYQTLLIQELVKFGRTALSLCPSNGPIQSRISHTPNSPSRSRQMIDYTQEQIQQRLFKSVLLLKRLQYGDYFSFFKAKVLHPNRKFWNQHYFEFQRTFGGKYFIIQIKNLITKK